jgi:protein involved in polysaccharide export with SLBB domain
MKADKSTLTAKDYILQPPDEVRVYCSRVPEIHLISQRIRPDGYISFESLGKFYAAGKTPQQLSDIMKERILFLYALDGDNPIDVRILAYKSKVFYVLGHVFSPGSKTCTGRDTVFRAVSEANPTNSAWLGRIQIIRPSRDESIKPKIYEVDFDKMSAHGELYDDVFLEEGDIVYVPPTVLAAVGLTVRELVSPVAAAFSTVNVVQGVPDPR